MKPKTLKIIYWTATIFIFLFEGVMPALTSGTAPAVEGIRHLGYPDYFRVMLTVFKVTGALALVLPMIKGRYKEWAYAGFFFIMTGALVSHLASGDDSVKGIIGPLMQTIFIILSWYFRPANRKIISVNFNK